MLLTALVAYDACQQDNDIVLPDGPAGSDGESVIGIGPGQVVSRSSLIRAKLKRSRLEVRRGPAIEVVNRAS